MKQRMRSLLAAMLALVLVLGLCPAYAGALSEEMENATPIAVGVPVEYSLESSGESVWYKITTTETGQYVVPVLDAADNLPVCSLRDSTGTNMNGSSRRYTTEAAGDYYLRLSSYGNSCAGTLTVTLEDNDSNEPNNNRATATALQSGDTVDFTVGYGDYDYFKVTTTQPGQDIAVTISGYDYTNQGDYLQLYYEPSDDPTTWYAVNGHQLSVSGNGTFVFHAAKAGEHYILLCTYSSDDSVKRTLSVSVLDGDSNELNDTKETATALPIDTDGTFSMGGYGDEDWFRFEVMRDAGQDQKLCTLNFFDLNSDYSDNFYYDLYAPDGTALSTGTYVNIRHSNVFACTQDGVYYLRVYSQSTSPSRSTLRVRVDEGGADPYESNDTWLTAASVQTGQPISFQLANTTDADWFRFEVPQADMTMVLTQNSGKQTDYQLWDAETLAEYGASDNNKYLIGPWSTYYSRLDSASTYYQTLRYKFTEPGTYYLRFVSDSGYVSEDLRTVTIDLEAATAEENNDTRAAATPLYDGVPRSFELSAYNDTDWFRIEIPAGTAALRISTTNNGGFYSVYYVYREADFELAGDNAQSIGSGGLNSALTLTAPTAGTYYVRCGTEKYSSYGHATDCTICYDLLAEAPAGSTIAAAAPLTSGEWAEGCYDGADYHYYSLGELATGTELRCYGENIAYFYLYDSEGNRAGSYYNDYNDLGNCAIPVAEDGSYYLEVQTFDTSIPYRLRCDIATETLLEGEDLTLETAADEMTLLVGERWKPEVRLAPYAKIGGTPYYQSTSSDSAVASYSGYLGAVTAVAVGTAKVTFTHSSSVSKTVTVNVVEPTPAASITVSGAPESLPLGTAAQLTATLNEGARENITWSSSDSSVLYVSSTGKVTAVGQGSATITAAGANVSDSVTIAVTAAPEKKKVTGVKLDDYDLTMYMGEEGAQLTATVTPADAEDAAVTWSTSNVDVASVTQDGTVTAKEVGVCVITASAGNYKASCVVTVLAQRKRVESISFDQKELEIRMNATSALTVNFAPADATVKTLTWVSSDPRVASVSRTGVVTGLAVGETTITATTLDGGHSASITVKVTAEGVKGDINGDGYIDAADAMLCLRAAVKLVELTADQKKVADVNGDGYIDAGDAIKLLRYDARLIDTLD